MEDFKTLAKQVTDENYRLLSAIDEKEIIALKDAILGAKRVFFAGCGRVFMASQMIAKRLYHLGIEVTCHGAFNEPAMTKDDLLIAGSFAGATHLPYNVCLKAKEIGAKVAVVGAAKNSRMKDVCDIFLRIPQTSPDNAPDEIKSMQPMISLFEQSWLMAGDIICRMIIDEKQLDMPSLWQYHANLE